MRNKWINIARLIIFLFLVYLIIKNVEMGEYLALMKNIHLVYFLISFLFTYTAFYVLSSRLRYICGIPEKGFLKIILVSSFFNNLFLAQIGGDIYKFYQLCQFIPSKAKASAVVFGDRMIGISGLLFFSLINIIFGFKYIPDRRIYLGVGFYILIVSAILLCIYFLPEKFTRSLVGISKIGPMVEKFDRLRMNTKKIFSKKCLGGLIYTFISYFSLILVNVFAIKSLGLELDFIASLLFIPVISVAVVTLPISFNGLGVRESLFILFFRMVGYTNEACLAMASINLINILLVSLLGGFVFLASKDKKLQHSK